MLAGDFRNGNLMVGADGDAGVTRLLAVLDWVSVWLSKLHGWKMW